MCDWVSILLMKYDSLKFSIPERNCTFAYRIGADCSETTELQEYHENIITQTKKGLNSFFLIFRRNE